MTLTQEQAKEMLSDKGWRQNHMYKIKTKDKRLSIMIGNKAQEHYRQNRTRRDMILKARQLGFSTEKIIEYLDDTITNENTTTAILAHKKEKVQTLFEIAKMAYNKLPTLLKPRVSFDNRNELYFPDLNSKIYITTDTRSETVHNLHISEFAFMRNAEDVLLAALESVPEKEGNISIESTANGMVGPMYEMWEDDKNEFTKHFYNWMWDVEYTTETHKTMEELMMDYTSLAIEYGLIPDIVERFNLTKGQLNFYIGKVRRHKNKVKQEYPTTALEAFIASGRNVFSVDVIQKHQAMKPIEKKWGDVLIWEQPLKGFQYVLSADTSEGLGQDNAVIEVFNAHTGFQAAELADSFLPPDELARYAIRIAKHYNNALIIPEINGSGLSFLNAIKNVYYNIYRRDVFDKISGKTKQSLGWRTTATTKPLLVDELENAMRAKDIEVNSSKALNECKTFVRTDDPNKHGLGAEGGKKDDRVIAMGLCVQGFKYLPRFKPPKTEAQKRLEDYIEEKRLSKAFPHHKTRLINRKRPRQYIRLNNKR